MNDMFKKVNAREKLIGWYHSGPKLRASDLEINELFKRYTPNPLLVIIDVQPRDVGVPTDAYFAVEEIKDVRLAAFLRSVCLQHGHHVYNFYTETDNRIGWNHDSQDLRSHSLDNRSRRGRRDRCRTSPS